MKQFIKRIAVCLVRPFMIKPEVVIEMDGGICSQMHFYLMGEMLRRGGCRVSFDLTWFERDGKDLSGHFCRNFDLLKLFPSLELRECRGVKRLIYRKLYGSYNDYFGQATADWLGVKAPAYLAGYYHDPEELYGRVFAETFSMDEAETTLSAECCAILAEIRSHGGQTAAIHVRRGDLSTANPAYGEPASVEYFRACVRRLLAEDGEMSFYLFSDEPEWVAEHLQPELEAEGGHFHLIDVNGSDRGYMDMVLMAACRHQITSKGSMGKFAALLQRDQSGRVFIPDDSHGEQWRGVIRRACFVGGDVVRCTRRQGA